MTKAIRAVVVLLVLAILTAVCIVSALDRQVAADRRYGRASSTLSMGPQSDRQRAIVALSSDQRATALRYARSAIARAPVDAGNLSLFGALTATTDRPGATRAVMTVAAALGWRDAVTQIFWLDDARRNNDFTAAAIHADALLRVDPTRQKARDMLVDLEAAPPGREAVAERLAGNPGWLGSYVSELRSFPSELADDRVRTLLMAHRRAMIGDCVLTGSVARSMVREDVVVPAAKLWYGLCEPGVTPTRGIGDSGFDRAATNEATSPFRWLLLPTGAVDVSIAPASAPLHGYALTYHSTSSADESIARLTLLLSPGRYRARWVERRDGPGGDGAVALALACASTGRRIASEPAGSANPDIHVRTFEVPAECDAQQLTFIAPPSGHGAIDDVMVAPLP